MPDVIERFATSAERCRILRGFLRYRAALREVGFQNGWHWIDGSFLERLEDREPGDIDLVTFLYPQVELAIPPDAALLATLVTPESKKRYSCDAYVVELRGGPDVCIRSAVYFYGLFSHQRLTFQWKGLLEISLSQPDESASALLEMKEAENQK